MNENLAAVIRDLGACVLAVSGGVDSLTLAVFASRLLGERFLAVHGAGPAVPDLATLRLEKTAAAQGFPLRIVTVQECADPDYAANPANRCYFCKKLLFAALSRLAGDFSARLNRPVQIITGTNLDDLGEFRPGLTAAAEAGVRHPYVEAGMDKRAVRDLAAALGLDFAEAPASPCLASRVYTGTRVTPEILRAVDFAEEYVKRATGLSVVRCRVSGEEMRIEVPEGAHVSNDLPHGLELALKDRGITFNRISLDPAAYRPGRAFVKTP